MVDQTQFQPQNPYALFSPDQWLNQFSNFNNKALPWPSSYAGMPTDAMGNPIAPPPGTTLNSSPAPAAPAAPAAPQQQGRYVITNPGGMLPSGENYGSQTPTYIPAQEQYIPAPQQQAPQAAPQAPQAAGGPTYPQILSMLANPGKVTTPGSNVPVSASSAQPGSANLQSFLANWKPAQSGPGSGFQQNFATALKGMGY
jgi:hypothetical protein